MGYLPLAPGTWGSLLGTCLVFTIHISAPGVAWAVQATLLLLIILAGTACSSLIARLDGDPDPSSVVIDEVAGQMLCQLWAPVTLFSLVSGFFLFRLFDIVKPFPARQMELLPGGFGIMGDDLAAGIYSGAALYLSHLLLTSLTA